MVKRTRSQEPGKTPNVKLEEVKSLLKDVCAEQKVKDNKKRSDDKAAFLQSGNCVNVRLVSVHVLLKTNVPIS